MDGAILDGEENGRWIIRMGDMRGIMRMRNKYNKIEMQLG